MDHPLHASTQDTPATIAALQCGSLRSLSVANYHPPHHICDFKELAVLPLLEDLTLTGHTQMPISRSAATCPLAPCMFFLLCCHRYCILQVSPVWSNMSSASALGASVRVLWHVQLFHLGAPVRPASPQESGPGSFPPCHLWRRH